MMSLSLENISKSFKDDLVLDQVSLSVETGETLVLFGPSGAGKTVLLRLIAGVIEPDEGTIVLNDADMSGVEAEHRGIGMAFQNFALFPHMDAHANIASPLTARKQPKNTIDTNVQKLAKLLKIDHVLGHQPKELSNGQKQRTALARALAGEPAILLLDDPLRNVDAKLRFEMRLELPRLLKDQNATVIYVTQDYKEAMAFGDNIAVMSGHGIQQTGTPEEIYLKPGNIETARLFGDPVINLIDVQPMMSAGNIQVRISETPIPIDAGYSKAVNTDCILGVRPEALRFVEKGTPNAFPITVEAETPLNEKTVNLMRTVNGRELMLSRPAGSPGPIDKDAYIAVDTGDIMLFEKMSGNRIEPLDAASLSAGEPGEVA
ncbi:ABC transporter ATP-binding protein [Lentilitoribacter sp. Alg239-R112]|uniref:ABC transporter ATP-binding protein n=1 Tax=Lentilitoribacter sp. Alg239-R112 TaxID=2305987 RepID=UPI001576CB63|nr:ABC transporter ATP-binding protein [Lentilitoribacter sp. Alg239-R112]